MLKFIQNKSVRLKMQAYILLDILLLFVLSVHAGPDDFNCPEGSEKLDDIPFDGRCVCEEQIWVSENCEAGYWCFDTDGNGCYKECPEGQFLITHVDGNYWECVEEGVGLLESYYLNGLPSHFDMVPDDRIISTCPADGGYHVCPSEDVDPPPSGPIYNNPLGTCRCDGELWVAEGCMYGFSCDSSLDIGGTYLECQEGETIEIDFEANTWSCTTTLGNCYGGPISGIGCKTPDCIRENNPFGKCECPEQFYLNSDCTSGFLCSEDTSDGFDGCYRQCLTGQVLIPDFEDSTWRCIDVDVADFECPGKFNLFCPDNDIGGSFDSAMCECDGQLLVSNDCKESFYCLDRLQDGGAALNCEKEGEIVELDFFNHQWECTNNTGNCPGLGGFALGCQGGGSDFTCPEGSEKRTEHPFNGRCACNEQVWVSEGCQEGYWCFDTSGAGCYKECPEGQFLVTHVNGHYWECVDEGVGPTDTPNPKDDQVLLELIQQGKKVTTCPADGGYHVCPSGDVDTPPNGPVTENPLGTCRCDGELWIAEGCKYGFKCDSSLEIGGEYIECPEEQRIQIDDFETYAWSCSDSLGNCYGGPIDGVGCTVPGCIRENNPFGTCQCADQFFLNSDCTQGFACTADISDGFDGCLRQCLAGQVLIPDFSDNSWSCMDADAADFECPGKFNLYCSENDIGSDFNSAMCECDGQLLVSSDCKESFYCLDRLPEGGAPLLCGDGEIVEVDFLNHQWECSNNTDNCPGLGGFAMGCQGGGIDFSCPEGSEKRTEHPFNGRCSCDEQLWVSEQCREGYWCFDTSGAGCYKECPDGQFLVTHVNGHYWECVDEGVGPTDSPSPMQEVELMALIQQGKKVTTCPADGGYHVCPSGNVDPPPEGPVTENPLGTCRCDGELWIAEGCKYGFKCDSNLENGGEYLECDQEERIQIDDFDTLEWSCTGSLGNCYGGPIDGIGCATPICSPDINPFGDCGCNEQFYLNSDCTEGFLCTDNVPDPDTQNGCSRTCLAGQVLIPDFTDNTWTCIDVDAAEFTCPGKFNLFCPLDDIGGDFDSSMCECDGQLIVSADCKESFYCMERFPNGGAPLNCEEEGQIVEVDFDDFSWKCTDNVDKCPGLGGFKLGCQSGNLEPPEFFCQQGDERLTEHPFGGRCSCDGQLWVSEGCKEGYWCYDTEGNGCYRNCPEGQFLVTHVNGGYWECVEEGVGPTDPPVHAGVSELMELIQQGRKVTSCPATGGYHVCPSGDVDPPPEGEVTENPLGTCRCDGELWIAEGCKYGFKCDSNLDIGGEYLECPEEERIQILDFETYEWGCTNSLGNCYGGPINGVGCEVPYCEDEMNPFGECSCANQFFLNENCTEGFLCHASDDNMGCMRRCLNNQVLVPDFADNSWSCIDIDNSGFKCPGKFNLFCPDDDVGGNFDDGQCDCDGQLIVSSDCKESFYCLSRFPEGGASLTCPEDGQIVDVDFENFNWQCSTNVDNCPGLGGFKIGCLDSNLEPPEFFCPEGSERMEENPLQGRCTCDGQLWVGENCQEGYWCFDTLGNGCYKECPMGEFLVTHVDGNYWECVEEGVGLVSNSDFSVALSALDYVPDGKTITTCPAQNGYHVCPSEDVDPPPNPDDVTENPLGYCRCDGEIWIAEGCRYGFICDGNEGIGGEYIYCPDGEYLQIDWDTKAWSCVNTPGNCYGGPLNGIGCPVPLCLYGMNPLGECGGCEGQFFLSDDCMEGFYCTSKVPDPYLHEGCMRSCLANQVLVPDFARDTWVCMDVDVADFVCPGAMNLYCPDEDIGTDFNSDMCDCDGQILVSADCKESFFCLSRLSGGGASLKCEAFGEIVDFDFINMEWKCTDNVGNCPSDMGGFKVGCENSQLPIPPPSCDLTTNPNPNGECECDGQLWVREDCREGFYCTEFPAEPDQTGCELICAEGERISVDLVGKNWECVPEEDEYVCPGSLHTDCQLNPPIECECLNQVWVSGNCGQAFRCTGPMEGDTNPGYAYACPQGYRIDVDFNYPVSYRCRADAENCPGSYHFGCTGDIPNLSTTMAPTSTVTPPFVPTGCNYQLNDLGTCDCDGEIFVDNDCRESFYCVDNPPAGEENQDGCKLTCSQEQRIHLDLIKNEWECVDREEDYVCPGKFNTDCDPNTEVECGCMNEVWIGKDCKTGFLCKGEIDEDGNNIGNPLGCILDDHILSTDFMDPLNVQCVPDVGQCPGSFHFGCEDSDLQPPPEINCDNEATNDLGTCSGCEGQIFVGYDCKSGFYCSDRTAVGTDGCALSCGDNERINFDLAANVMECVPDDGSYICPGDYQSDCDDNEAIECGCSNEIWVFSECSNAFVCREEMDTPSGGEGEVISCPEGQIVDIDLTVPPFDIKCTDQIEKCPGNYHFGCDGGDFGEYTTNPADTTTTDPTASTTTTTKTTTTPTTTPTKDPDATSTSTTTTTRTTTTSTEPGATVQCETPSLNTIGECYNDCENIYVANDCKTSFFCTDRLEDNSKEGCLTECGDGERVSFDFTTEVWECVPMEDNFICPGVFSTDCEPSFDVKCGCHNEVWMDSDCGNAFICDAEAIDDINRGFMIQCPPQQVVQINLLEPLTYECVSNVNMCQGSFHYGCEDGELSGAETNPPPDATPAPTTTTPSSSSSPPANRMAMGVVAGFAIAMILSRFLEF